jgi:hypothetical protein
MVGLDTLGVADCRTSIGGRAGEEVSSATLSRGHEELWEGGEEGRGHNGNQRVEMERSCGRQKK